MPKQHRWYIKRKLDQAISSVDRAQKYLVEVGQEYKTPHPEIYQQFCDVVAYAELLKKMIQIIRDEI